MPGRDADIVIVGAGIGGLTTAIALAQAGYQPVVCEKASRIQDIGGAITIRTNATRILKNIGVFDALAPFSSKISSASVYNQDGKFLRRWRLPTGIGTIIIRRTDLQLALLDHLRGCPHRLLLDHACVNFEQGQDKIVAIFSNDSVVDGAALIGADGLNSSVRRQIVGN